MKRPFAIFCIFLMLPMLWPAVLPPSPTPEWELPPEPTPQVRSIDDWILTCSQINNLDPKLVHAVITVESNWDPNAVSYAGAQGLMQIMPNDFSYYFKARDSPTQLFDLPEDPFNIYSNILAGTNALAIWRTICQDRGLTEVADYLSCYNMGYNYFKSGNRSYANKVIQVYEESEWEATSKTGQ